MPCLNSNDLSPRRLAGLSLILLGLVPAWLTGCTEKRVPEVAIVQRAEWADTDPMFERLVKHTPKRLTIHHEGMMNDGSVPGDEKLRRLLRFSLKQKPWGDVPYHYVIDRTGCIRAARSMTFAPDTNTGYDVIGHITICVNGDLTKQPLLEPQYRALVNLLVKLSAELKIPDDQIAGHMDYSPGKTTCPGALETYIKNGWLVEDMEQVRKGRDYTFRVPDSM